MNGWMFVFMGAYYNEFLILCLGLVLVVTSIWCIRTQFMVSIQQYIQGMIPHHSMAIHMSKKLIQHQQKDPLFHEFLSTIITTQEKEINYMKQVSQAV